MFMTAAEVRRRSIEALTAIFCWLLNFSPVGGAPAPVVTMVVAVVAVLTPGGL